MRSTILCGIMTIGILSHIPLSGQAAIFRTVALSGIPVPGTEPDVVFSNFFDPVIGTDGQVVFTALLTGPGVVAGTNNEGIWSEASGALGLVARTGTAAPGTPVGTTFTSLSKQGFPGRQPHVDANGNIAFVGSLGGAGVGLTNDTGIWSSRSSSLELIVREGTPAPGVAAGLNFGTILDEDQNTFFPATNAAGQLVFQSHLRGPGVDVTNFNGIWSDVSGSLEFIVRRGDASDGMGPETTFLSVGNARLNDLGEVIFTGTSTGSGVNSSNDEALWIHNSGGLSLVAREGDPVPGTSTPLAIGDPKMNSDGKLAFRVRLSNPPPIQAIFTNRSGSFEEVIHTGDPLPAGGSVVYFDQNVEGWSFNDLGQIAFQAYVTGPSVEFFNEAGIWLDDGFGNLEMIARKGDVAPGAGGGSL